MMDSHDDDDDSSRRYSSTTTHRQRDSLVSVDSGNDVFAEFKALRDHETVQFEDDRPLHHDNHSSSCWRRRIHKNHPVMQSSLWQPTTWAGAFMFLLYHVVFVLAFGSALMRPHHASSKNNSSMLGTMAKFASVGIFGAGPFYIYRLNQDIPAVYPSVDLFLAPFFAQAAVVVDESLWQQQQQQQPDTDHRVDDDAVFLGSFAVLTSLGMALTAVFLWLGSTFKLANLGTYLPYSVLSGFFSAVGVLLWCLAFSVDTAGQSWKTVFFSGDAALILNSALHHLPSLAVGLLMNRLGPKNPFFVILLIGATVTCFYSVMWWTGTTLADAQRARWFWSVDELVYQHPAASGSKAGTDPASSAVESDAAAVRMIPSWALPPAPFGSLGAVLAGHVNWTAT